MRIRLLRQVIIGSILFGLIVYFFNFSSKKEKTSNFIYIKPSYVVAVRGNAKVPLYAQVRGIPLPNETVIMVTKESLANSQTFTVKINKISKEKKENNYYLNYHTWHEICDINLNSLLNYPLFPHLPALRKIVDNLELQKIEPMVGERIFGYLIPQKSSEICFSLSSDNMNIQVWLSTSSLQQDAKLLLVHNPQRKGTIYSGYVKVTQGEKYYIDIIIKTGTDQGKFILKWISKGEKNFQSIRSLFLHPFLDELSYTGGEVNMDSQVPRTLSMLVSRKKLTELYNPINYRRSRIYTLPFIVEEDVQELFPLCEYQPSYVVKTKLKQEFQGVWETHFTEIYPEDESNITYKLVRSDKRQVIFGNPLLDEKVADAIVKKVMKYLQQKHRSKYTLVHALNVERNHDPSRGDRFLVELELKVEGSSQTVRFSEYVYLPNNNKTLCYPDKIKWNKKADVNVILTVGHQGRWAKHFVDTMSRIYDDTRDPNLNVVIVDFDSKDVDLVRALEESSLKRYTLLKRKGKFHKTEAIQAAVNTVQDPDAITLQVDLHLTIPSDFIDHVRKHTIQGVMTYSPLLARLQCGANPQQPYGFWEISGYGIMSIYKSDWNIIGGMDIEKFRNKWGGEDWDLLDRVLNAGYEIERIKIRNFYHVFHSKKRLWHQMV